MKKKILLCYLGVALLAFSCKKDETSSSNQTTEIKSFKDLKKIPNAIVDIKTERNIFNEIIKGNKESQIEFLRDSAWSNGLGSSLIYRTDEYIFPENQSRLIYPGALMDATGVKDLKYVPISKFQSKVKPITVSISAPGKNVSGKIEVPSTSATREFINSIFGTTYGIEIAGFQFDMNQFTYYDEIKLSVGANVNIGTLFSVGASYGKEKVQNTTGLVAKFIQKNFTLDMDLPDEGELLKGVSPAELGPYSPLYVSSITYGRMGIIKVESSYSYNEVKYAFNLAFKAASVGVGVNLDAKTLEIINNSEIKVVTIGGDGSQAAKSINGFADFKAYILSGGNYSEKAPGFPLYFTLSHLSDHSVYSTIFNVNIPKQ